MTSLNVLLTAASRRVALVRAFRRALGELGVDGSVVTIDVNPHSPALDVADRAYLVPLSSDAGYLDAIERICQQDEIGLVIPTIDDELGLFAAATERLARLGVRVAVSPLDTCEVCNDKFETCRVLTARGVAAATSYLPETLPSTPPLPLFVKPRGGRGGVGAVAVRTRRELEFFLGQVERPVIQDYLDGPEFTIDLLCDFGGRPLAVVPRERIVIRAGVMDRGRTVRDTGLIELGLDCASALSFRGAVNIQCRVVDGRPVVFEVNPRFSGGIPLTIAAGVDMPRLLIELALGRSVRPRVGEFRAGVWMSSYETSVFFQEGERMAQDRRAVAPPSRQEVGSEAPPHTVQTRVGSRVAARRSSMARYAGAGPLRAKKSIQV